MYDVVIIGAGVTGAAVARELARYRAKVLVLEKEEDVCCGTSKANSAIVHGGYDAEPGSMMARMNVEGNRIMGELAKELDFPFERCGSLVVCRDPGGLGEPETTPGRPSEATAKGYDAGNMVKPEATPGSLPCAAAECKDPGGLGALEALYEKGVANGVEGLEIITDRERIRRLEPNLAPGVVAALFAPTAGIVCPFGLTIALAENAADNGVEFVFDAQVTGIGRVDGGYALRVRMRNHAAAMDGDDAASGTPPCGGYERAYHGRQDEKVGVHMEAAGMGGAGCSETVIKARAVVNAAGVHGDELHNMVAEVDRRSAASVDARNETPHESAAERCSGMDSPTTDARCSEPFGIVSGRKLHITPRRGEYVLLDKAAGGHVNHVVFSLPDRYGKGVLVTRTIHGNLLLGPTAKDIDDKAETATTAAGLTEVLQKAGANVAGLPLRQVITSFAGLRAHEDGHDFVIGEVEGAPGFFDAVGIESPGLTAAPAIGRYLAGLVSAKLGLRRKPVWPGGGCAFDYDGDGASGPDGVPRRFVGDGDTEVACSRVDSGAHVYNTSNRDGQMFRPRRTGIVNPASLPIEERLALIRENPSYGAVVCRCEGVTEGEILDAIRRPLGAKSMDGVKRRVRAGMGRCQGGFCSPRVMELLAQELGLQMEHVTKSGGESRMLLGVR
ncbi:MAG: NAD(P)/FAD-dependent oxidoreductase [Lachnospiraceae bacterium]|jgi:glycerol-3-phosphate dehydrogenase|nr:NAD(P)/FAD-dependent oxidoreductase [Lachnospiraceae bacterium]